MSSNVENSPHCLGDSSIVLIGNGSILERAQTVKGVHTAFVGCSITFLGNGVGRTALCRGYLASSCKCHGLGHIQNCVDSCHEGSQDVPACDFRYQRMQTLHVHQFKQTFRLSNKTFLNLMSRISLGRIHIVSILAICQGFVDTAK